MCLGQLRAVTNISYIFFGNRMHVNAGKYENATNAVFREKGWKKKEKKRKTDIV